MEVGRWDMKLAVLKAVQSLCSHRTFKSCVAKAGGVPIVPIVLNHLFSGMSPGLVRESASIIIDNIAENDGIEYFVDGNGAPIDEYQTVENLLAVYENSSNFPVIRRHVLHTLLGLLSQPDSKHIRDTFRSMCGISTMLPLIEGPVREVQDCVVRILFHLSESGGSEIAEYMQKQKNYRALLKLLENNVAEEVQIAAPGILVNLPPHGPAVTDALVEAEAISILVELLRRSTPKIKKAAVDALVRFTDPSNIKMQQAVASLNIHPLLVRTIFSGTIKSKARAAAALRNFSSTTPTVSVEHECRA